MFFEVLCVLSWPRSSSCHIFQAAIAANTEHCEPGSRFLYLRAGARTKHSNPTYGTQLLAARPNCTLHI